MDYEETIRKQAAESLALIKSKGVIYKPNPNWAAYGELGDGHNMMMVNIFDLAESIESAEALITLGDTEDITEALLMVIESNCPVIEVCGNNEWLRVYGGYEPEEDTGNDEIDEKKFSEDCEKMENSFPEAEFIGAVGQRILCHGWNGAGFTHRACGHGAFDVLTVHGEKLWDSI